MTRIRAIATAAVVTLVLGLPAGAAAQMPDTRDRTIMTFSAPVELPGMRLEAGTYVFKLADTPLRNIVQVFTHDEMDILGQWLYVPAERRDPTGETIVSFRESSAGSTPAVQFWFYPGETIGKEFIYPKDQAMRIASRTGATVMTEDGPVEANARASADAPTSVAVEETTVVTRQEGIGVVEGSGLPEPEPAATSASASTSASVVMGSQSEPEPVGTTGVAAQAETSTSRGFAGDELPQTGGTLALTSLMAVLSLAGVAAFRRYRR